MDIMAQYMTELLVGGMLILFGILARSLAHRVITSQDTILSRLDYLYREFHEHKLEDARMWSRIDAEVHGLYKRLDRELPNGGGKKANTP